MYRKPGGHDAGIYATGPMPLRPCLPTLITGCLTTLYDGALTIRRDRIKHHLADSGCNRLWNPAYRGAIGCKFNRSGNLHLHARLPGARGRSADAFGKLLADRIHHSGNRQNDTTG